MNVYKIAKNHYDDCPYGCNVNGMILDSSVGKLVPCPHCSKRKKELMAQGCVEEVETDVKVSLNSVLGINSEFLSARFVYDSAVPEGERLFMDSESIEWQKGEAEELYLALSIGQLPETSLCFGIGVKGRVDIFVYPMLAKAYLNNINVSPFISCSEYCRKAYNLDDAVDLYMNSDLVIMLINDGASLADISAAKGLMQTRALKGRPTVFVTTWTIEACSGLLGFKDDASLFLAKPVFVRYKTGKNSKHSPYINNLLGVENDMYVEQGVSNGVSNVESKDGGVNLGDIL